MMCWWKKEEQRHVHFYHANDYMKHWHPREHAWRWNLAFWQLYAYLSEKSTPNWTPKMKSELGEVIDSFKEHVSSPFYLFIHESFTISIDFKRWSLTV